MKKYTLIVLAVVLAVIFISSCTTHVKNADTVSQLEPLTPYGAMIVPDNWKMDSINTSGIKTKYIGVPYGKVSKTQTLDIYLPNKGNEPFPVIIVVHGGGFSMGNSMMLTDVGPMLEGLNRGYAIVSVNYRLSGEALFPRAVNDVKAAVRFVKANAKKYNLNPYKIAAWGGSAGGNLVTMIGTTGNANNLNGDNTENLNYSSEVKAVVDWFGPCDFTKFDTQFIAAGFESYNSSVNENSHESWYIGQNVMKDTVLTEKANPETYISTMDPKKAPCFFIQHGTLDPVVPVQQSINLTNSLKEKLGVSKVKFEPIEGAHHFSPEFSAPENINKVFDFLDSVLKQSYPNYEAYLFWD